MNLNLETNAGNENSHLDATEQDEADTGAVSEDSSTFARLERAIARAIAALGDREKAFMVDQVLVRIEHGIVG